MTEDLEPTPEEIERWTRNLLKPSAAPPTSIEEQRMIEKVLGTKTAAEHFLRRTGKPAPSHARNTRVRERRYRPIEVLIHYDYFDRPASDYGIGGWTIERYENGRKTAVQSGTDYQQRDDLLIRYQAAGFTCKPVTVAELVPAPIQGRMRDKPKPASSKASILARIGKITTDDLEDEY
ncbi:hypothetical protein ABK249_11990 [Neorhizobium sp. Rsf11]|uniref:Uncharacterized protein n=1 Tax=Neorhizobium phenanthreniclasticum TaxID=3157917 RepID=A0ABV0M1C8_9HYPH